MPHRMQQANSAGSVRKTPPFNKVFRWQPEKPGSAVPTLVEVTGSFNSWKRVALVHDRVSNAWQVTLNNLPGNCTHRYMLLVDGQPTNDKHCNGLAVPHSDEEKQYQLVTARGPRIFMLFSDTK